MSRFDGIEIAPALMDGLRRGERGAAAQLYGLLSRPVYGLAVRVLGDADAAAEVTHDTFLAVMEGVGSVRGDDKLVVWVRRIAVNACLMRLRSPWLKRRGVDPSEPVDGAVDAARMNGWHDLERALRELPAPTRFVVWMHEVEGYTHAELAELLNRSVSYSKSQLARGLARLRAVVDREEDRDVGH